MNTPVVEIGRSAQRCNPLELRRLALIHEGRALREDLAADFKDLATTAILRRKVTADLLPLAQGFAMRSAFRLLQRGRLRRWVVIARLVIGGWRLFRLLQQTTRR